MHVRLTPGMTREDFYIMMRLHNKRWCVAGAMIDHDTTDYEMTTDWMKYRRQGRTWAELARLDAESLDSVFPQFAR